MPARKLKDVPKKKKIETLIMLGIALAIVIGVFIFTQNSRPKWQREEDSKIAPLTEEQRYAYTQTLFAQTLLEDNPNEVTDEGWSWKNLYEYVSNQTHYFCYQLPNTIATSDTPINDFVRCIEL